MAKVSEEKSIPSWQTDLAREYARTSGNQMSFGSEQPDGWFSVSCFGVAAPLPGRHQLQKSAAMARTDRLRRVKSYSEGDVK